MVRVGFETIFGIRTCFYSILKLQGLASLLADWERDIFQLMLLIFDVFAGITIGRAISIRSSLNSRC